MIDLNNPIFVAPWSPQAEWKRALLIELGRRFNLRHFIETGTSTGETVAALADHFDSIRSFELSSVLAQRAQDRFQNYGNVIIEEGSSGVLLEQHLLQLRYIKPQALRCLIWLDAHYTGGESAGVNDPGYGPLPQELTTIFKLAPEALVVIDDVQPNFVANIEFALLDDHTDWQVKFLNGVAIAHHGQYDIPEKF